MWWSQTVHWCPPASGCPPLWTRGDGRRPRHPQPSHQWSHSKLLNLSGKCTEKYLYFALWHGRTHLAMNTLTLVLYPILSGLCSSNSKRGPCSIFSRYILGLDVFLQENKTHHIPRWFNIVGSKIRDIGGKPLVEPQVIPPPCGHQVPKPLRAQRFILLAGFLKHISKPNTNCQKYDWQYTTECPNTIWASSCEMTVATHSLSPLDDTPGLYKRAVSL